jgi:hypothetical protein
MSLKTSSGSSDEIERSSHDDTAGYKLRKRSRETRNKMARMARAMYEDEDDDDYLSESDSVPAKRPRSHVRASATKRERARMHKLNNAYDKLRKVVPKLNCDTSNERLSKIATLRLAIDYITMLTDYLDGKMEKETVAQDSTENSADEDTTSSIDDDSNILAKLIESVVDEFGWFLGRLNTIVFRPAMLIRKTVLKSLNITGEATKIFHILFTV